MKATRTTRSMLEAAQRHHEQGQDEEAREFEQAVQHFRQALALEPTNVELSYRVFSTLVRNERLVEAEELARSLLTEQPDRADRHIALGRVLAKQRQDFQSREDYLATYGRIDIALDPLPYGGHTTSLDAYWMGVPVVTLVGDTIVGRAGLSFASNLLEATYRDAWRRFCVAPPPSTPTS